MKGVSYSQEVLYPSQWRTECPPERFVEGLLRATRGDSLRVAQVMCLRDGCGGCCVRHWLGGSGGLGLCHSPLRCRGGPCTNRNKLKECRKVLFVFVHRPFAYKSKLLTLGPGTKKALKRCLRAFFFFCGERGIRTPGTVTRTSV